ncbi:MAG: hypothetical protein RLZZ562_84 [Planctomycetota bacterium]|jgi:hypothetical protein
MTARIPGLALAFSLPIALLLALGSCGGGGGGGGDADVQLPDNTAPILTVPSGLTGTPPRLTWNVAAANSASVTFTAVDAEQDTLQWQLAGSSSALAAAGVSATGATVGNSFVVTLDPVVQPAFAVFQVLVQDGRATAGFEVTTLRTGAPSIQSVQPASAFAAQPLSVNVNGTGLTLGGLVQAGVTFGGASATNLAAQDDGSVTCLTPSISGSGQAVVAVSNAQGSDQLPASAFRMMPYPAQFAATDALVDSSFVLPQFDLALDGATADVASNGSAVVHARSTDGGASFGASTFLSGAETPTGARIAVVGDAVHVAWIGDGQQVHYRRSTDGGASFSTVALLGTGTQPATGLRIAATATHVFVAWISGSVGLSQARAVVASSQNAGASFTAPVGVASSTQNQRELEIAASSDDLVVAFLDDRLTSQFRGIYVARSGNGGLSFGTSLRLSAANRAASALDLYRDGTALHLVFTTIDGVLYNGSPDFGVTWRTPEVLVRGTDDGVPAEPRVYASLDRVYVLYTTDGTAVRIARSSDSGASFPARTRLDAGTVPVSSPRITGVGEYVTVAWMSGDVQMDSVRGVFSTSVNRGSTWRPAELFGNGASNQTGLALRQSGARLLLGFVERRSLSYGVFCNANLP